MGIKSLFGRRPTPEPSSTPESASSPMPSPGLPPVKVRSSKDSDIISLRSNPASRSAIALVSPPSLSRENSSASSAGLSRVRILEDGSHAHILRAARRQEKLGRMLREIMGSGQRIGNDAISAVPDFVRANQSTTSCGVNNASRERQPPQKLSLMHGLVHRVAKGEVEVDHVNGSSFGLQKSTNRRRRDANGNDEVEFGTESLVKKYGKCQEVIGRGAYGTVRVCHKSVDGADKLFAVKEFNRRSAESEKTFQDRLMSEFCISSSLHHPNIIETLDLMKDAHGGCCQIMEYCSGGDLYSLVLSSQTGLKPVEADCFFKQILRGVMFMQSMGVAHCDLKPENILLTCDGVVKISDFGNGECFRMAWEETIHLSKGLCGSAPYIAPEEYKSKPFDPRAVDIWALGIIYMVMRTGSYLWRSASSDDDHYVQYLSERKTSRGFAPIEKLAPSKCVYVIYSILDPVPQRRITGKQILNSEWCRSIHVCAPADCGIPQKSATAPGTASSVTPNTAAIADGGKCAVEVQPRVRQVRKVTAHA